MKGLLKRSWFWLLLLFVLGLSGAFILSRYGKPAISRASMSRIKTGMTPADVERIIGTRPGKYGGSDQFKREYSGKVFTNEGMVLQDTRYRGWINDVGYIVVRFDSSDRVRFIQLVYHNGEPPLSMWERILSSAEEWFRKKTRPRPQSPGPYFGPAPP